MAERLRLSMSRSALYSYQHHRALRQSPETPFVDEGYFIDETKKTDDPFFKWMRITTNIQDNKLFKTRVGTPKDVESKCQNTAIRVVKPERIQFENKVSLRQNKLNLYPDKIQLVRIQN